MRGRGRIPLGICGSPKSGCGTEASARRLDNRQAPRQELQPVLIADEALQRLGDLLGARMVRKVEDDDSGIVSRWIVPDVCEIEVASDENQSFGTSALSDDVVRRAAQADIAHVERLVSQVSNGVARRSWKAGVQKEAQALSSGGQRVVLLLVDQLASEFQGGPDVLDAQTVLALHVLEAHPAGEAADDDGDRRTRTPNHGLPVTDPGVDDDPVFHPEEEPTRTSHPSQGSCRGGWSEVSS